MMMALDSLSSLFDRCYIQLLQKSRILCFQSYKKKKRKKDQRILICCKVCFILFFTCNKYMFICDFGWQDLTDVAVTGVCSWDIKRFILLRKLEDTKVNYSSNIQLHSAWAATSHCLIVIANIIFLPKNLFLSLSFGLSTHQVITPNLTSFNEARRNSSQFHRTVRCHACRLNQSCVFIKIMW